MREFHSLSLVIHETAGKWITVRLTVPDGKSNLRAFVLFARVNPELLSCLRLSFSLFFSLSLSLSLHFVLLRGSVRIGWSRTETAVGRISTDFASSCVGTDQGWSTRLRHRLQELENSAFMVYDPIKVQTSFPVVKMNQNQYWLISDEKDGTWLRIVRSSREEKTLSTAKEHQA